MTFGRLIRVLSRNNISWNLKTSGRILFLLQSSVWSSIFATVEKFRYGKLIKVMPCPDDPVFIIGHWRTGTSLLFKLMSLDEQFTAPTLFQVAEPDSMLTSHAYYKPVMKTLVGETRPMDNVRIGMDEPQEDEYAVFRLTACSPLEQLVFPCREEYFLEKFAECKTLSKTEEQIKTQLKFFFTKINYHRNGTILSKNPFHSFRIRMLMETFPKARFIQIHRHPFSVVPSTINMWDILQRENALNNELHKHGIAETCKVMNLISENISAGTAALPEGSFAETRFEDLEHDPVNTLRKLYAVLKLDFPEGIEIRIKEFMAINRNFAKNKFLLSDSDKEVIESELNDYMRKYSYS